jgi:hypothetical protein
MTKGYYKLIIGTISEYRWLTYWAFPLQWNLIYILLGSIMKKLNLELIRKHIVEQLYRYREMIVESIEYSGHFRQLMESNVRFRVILRRFSRQLEPVLKRRLPSYIHKLFDAFKSLYRNRDTSKLTPVFTKDQDIFNVYEKNMGILSDLFKIYCDPKFKLNHNIANQMSQSSEAEVLHGDEMQASVVVSNAKL